MFKQTCPEYTWEIFQSKGFSRDDLDWAVIREEYDDEEGCETQDTLAFVVTETAAERARDLLVKADPEANWIIADASEGCWDDMDWAVVRTSLEDGDVEVIAITQTEYLAEKIILDRLPGES